jgi:chromate reductase
MTTYKVGIIIGSLSKSSINRLLARALMRVAPPELEFSEIAIKDLPFYSTDYESNYPQAVHEFKEALSKVDAVLFVTPEYNRSIPAALKNAVDWASRPRGQNSLAHKPSGVIGASTGAIGTAVAQQHLRGMLAFLNSPQMAFPEGYIQFKPGLITEEGEITVDSTREFLGFYMTEYAAFIKRVMLALQQTTA